MRKPALLFALSLLLLIANGCSIPVWTSGEVPFVPTPIDVINRMLEMAQVKSGDVIYDIGSGDGRIIIQAAKKYGSKSIRTWYRKPGTTLSEKKLTIWSNFVLRTRSQPMSLQPAS